MRKYDHKKIERKWQAKWGRANLYKTPDRVRGKKNYYLLTEFPYPSGNLHVGHWYAFSVPDILARMRRMQGKNVLYPIGFDAFGLPAENAAIKNKLNPRKWTFGNIAYMKKQMASMGASFDWSREVITCASEYYKWTQWQFLQFFKKGLAYQKETAVNWCPSCKTVLANEQVIDGRCERCKTEVIQKQMLQWNLKITDYADRLVDDLTDLDWPEQIKESQRNWIGRSEGAEIDFPLEFENVGGPKPNYLILHGWYKESSAGAFIPWLKRTLEDKGFNVQAPDLPNPELPKEVEQVERVLTECNIDERTIIIGHSLGGTVAMKLLEKINRPIAGLVLVAPAMNPSVPGAKPRPFWKTFDWNIDYSGIKKLAGFVSVLCDLQEGEPRVPYLRDIAAKLQVPLIEGNAAEKHFFGKEEPLILKSVTAHLKVFTTRPDTLFGATYMVVSPEHAWLTAALQHKNLLKNNREVQAYVDQAAKKTELERLAEQKEKSGVKLEGVEAINPATGKKIPVYVADYVLAHYGTGAIMAVPAHDERDFEFAKWHHLLVKEVIEPLAVHGKGLDAVRDGEDFVERNSVLAFVKHWSEEKYIGVHYKPTHMHECVSGGIESGEDAIAAAKREILEETGYKNARFVRQLGGLVHAKYYSVEGKQNRFVHFTPLLFKLKDGEQEEVSEHESSRHDISWLTTDEMESFLNRDEIKEAWKRVVGKVEVYTGDGILAQSGEFSGLSSVEARRKMTDSFGVPTKTYKLRDWLVSRQRYWGVPIPIIHCKNCGKVAVPDKDLPVILPEIKDYLPDGSGRSPLAKVKKWVNAKCPSCKGQAERETDTLDTFVDSSWYFLRYADPKNKKKFADVKKMDMWMPIDLYSGGAEHTTMHVLYSRFWQKALYDLKLVKDKEPYTRRMNRSIILGHDGQKMSKSRGNVVDPDEVVARLGADTVRMYLAFIGPYNEVSSYPWNPDGVVGVRRFLERVWRLHDRHRMSNIGESESLERTLHMTIKKVSEHIPAMKFNTAIAQMMAFLNDAERGGISKKQYETLLVLLSPFAPHIAEELWKVVGHKRSIHLERWPKFDARKLISETIKIAVQVNGKTRTEIEIRTEAPEESVKKQAQDAAAKWLEGKNVAKIIYVRGRIVNIVT